MSLFVTDSTSCPFRSRGAGKEDDGRRGAAVSQRSAVGSGDFRGPVDGHGPTHASEPTEFCRAEAATPEQCPGTMTAPGPQNLNTSQT